MPSAVQSQARKACRDRALRKGPSTLFWEVCSHSDLWVCSLVGRHSKNHGISRHLFHLYVSQLGVGNDVSWELFATHSEEELKTYKQLEWDLLPPN